MDNDLLAAISASHVERASEVFRKKISQGEDALKIHDSLFPVVQRVINPPYINPHLPKMYRICRELFTHLEKSEIPDLVHLEVKEYARRKKLDELPKASQMSSVLFREIETAINDDASEKTAQLLSSFYALDGGTELARRLLLIGSDYLGDSLGHSVSCTAFMLLEMTERSDQDAWPAIAALADYFCKGRYSHMPRLEAKKDPDETAIEDHLLKASSGQGIVNLHHTITLYAIERARQFLKPEEHAHVVQAWIEFIGDKRAQPFKPNNKMEAPRDYAEFYRVFSRFEADQTVAGLAGLLDSDVKRRQLGRFLVKAVCDSYQGNYDPHFITGLGSALWVTETYWNQPSLALTALHQYINYFYANR